MELEEFWEDASWGEENYGDLQRKYQDKWVAIVGKKIVSSGKNRREVKEHAIKLTGKKYIPLIYIESGAVIY